MCKDTTFFRDLQIFPNKSGQNILKLTKLCDSYFNDIFNVRGDRVGCWCSVGGVFANTPPCSTPVNKGLPRDFGGVLGVWLSYPYSKECSVSNNANRGMLYTRSVTLVMCTHHSAAHSR